MNKNVHGTDSIDRAKANIRFEELGANRAFKVPELRARADGNPWASGRKRYKVFCGDHEVAYLSFDIWPEDELNLYEVFCCKGAAGAGRRDKNHRICN